MNSRGSSMVLAIGVVFLLTVVIVSVIYRVMNQTQSARVDRLLNEEVEAKRSLVNVVALKYRQYVLGNGSINTLISTCDKDAGKFSPWYSDSYQSVDYRVSACDNTDSSSSYTNDTDQMLWFRIDANYNDGRQKTYYALLNPSITPTPTVTPSPTVTPTDTILCYQAGSLVPCPSPTPCTNKGTPIPCPTTTPCTAWWDTSVFIPCSSCTDKFGTPTSCPSPTPPPSPTPTPTPTPPPSPTPTTPPGSPTPPPCGQDMSGTFYGSLLNVGMLESRTATACGHTLKTTIVKEGTNVRLRCYLDNVEVATTTRPLDTNCTYWIDAHISRNNPTNPGYMQCADAKMPSDDPINYPKFWTCNSACF